MRVLVKLERLLLVVGLLLSGIYVGSRVYRDILSQAAIESFKEQQFLPQDLNSGTNGAGKSPDFKLWSAKRIQGYQESLAAHFAPAIAVLSIPKIHLEVPVLEGTDDLSLNRAVGHIKGTPKPGEAGNVGIAGHRDGFFRGLKDVAAGDSIEVTTQKETSVYVIDQIVIVDPTNVSVLAPRSRSSITLVTCYPFYFVGSAPQRFIVQASLKSSAANESAKF